MKNLMITTLSLIFLISAISVNAQNQEKDRNKFRSQFHSELNLSDVQETIIKELKLAHEKEMIELKADVERKELELKELRNNGNYTREEYLGIKSEIIEAQNKITMARASHQMDVYELLNDEQKITWNEKGMMFQNRSDGKRNFMKRQHNNF